MTFQSWNRNDLTFLKSLINNFDKNWIFVILENSHAASCKYFRKFHLWTFPDHNLTHIYHQILEMTIFCWINFETYNTQKCRSCFEIAISNQNRCGQDTKGDTVEVTIKQRNSFNILWTKIHSLRHSAWHPGMRIIQSQI